MPTRLVAFCACLGLLAWQCSCLTPAEYALGNNPSAEDVTGIQQTLGLFPVAIDQKQFDLLDAVFTTNATANFRGPSLLVGVPAIKRSLSKGLTGLISQHDLGTLYINMTEPDKAVSYNWLQGTFFGTGNSAGQTFSFFGYYRDHLVQSHGRWYIQDRFSGEFVGLIFLFVAPFPRFSLNRRCISSSLMDGPVLHSVQYELTRRQYRLLIEVAN